MGDAHDGVNNTECVSDGGDTSNMERIVVMCNPALTGRYLHMLVPDGKHLMICEVQVYGPRGKELPLTNGGAKILWY